MPKKLQLVVWLLLLYVLTQFGWWAYQIYTLSGGNVWMVVGEGSVFVIILLIGFWFVRRSIIREVDAADQQRNFLLAITHELKTPIAAMRLYLETILKRDLSADKRAEMLQKAVAENVRIDGLINDVLTAARIESQGAELQAQKLNILQSVSPLVGSEVDVQIPNDLSINIDSKAFEIIVSSLLDNAIKYGNAPVSICAERSNQKVLITVSDQGPGIPDHEKAKVLHKFYRIGHEETRTHKGTGLGLYLVNELVKASGGRLSLKDNLPKGCIFVVDFPDQ